jgi:hypothetical protein
VTGSTRSHVGFFLREAQIFLLMIALCGYSNENDEA